MPGSCGEDGSTKRRLGWAKAGEYGALSVFERTFTPQFLYLSANAGRGTIERRTGHARTWGETRSNVLPRSLKSLILDLSAMNEQLPLPYSCGGKNNCVLLQGSKSGASSFRCSVNHFAKIGGLLLCQIPHRCINTINSEVAPDTN